LICIKRALSKTPGWLFGWVQLHQP